jgi:hypothetical protein
MLFFQLKQQPFAANSMFCFSIFAILALSFSFISMNHYILIVEMAISSRLFSLKMSFPVSKISLEISHDFIIIGFLHGKIDEQFGENFVFSYLVYDGIDSFG